ncbi:MAG: hypothetical protein ABIJ61_00135, partial [bacterium]
MRLLSLTLAMLLASGGLIATLAAPGEQPSLEIEFGKNFCRFTARSATETAMTEFELNEVTRTDRQILVSGQLLADELGFHVGQYLLPYEDLEVRRVSAPRQEYSILLESKIAPPEARRRRSTD